MNIINLINEFCKKSSLILTIINKYCRATAQLTKLHGFCTLDDTDISIGLLHEEDQHFSKK